MKRNYTWEQCKGGTEDHLHRHRHHGEYASILLHIYIWSWMAFLVLSHNFLSHTPHLCICCLYLYNRQFKCSEFGGRTIVKTIFEKNSFTLAFAYRNIQDLNLMRFEFKILSQSLWFTCTNDQSRSY